MTDAVVDIGDLPNDGTGDPLRVAFDKINQNFANVALLAPSGPNGSFQFNNAGYPLGTANLVYDSANNIVNIGSDLVPTANATVEIGSSTRKISKLFLDKDSMRLGNVSIVEDGNTISFPITVFPSVNASISVQNVNANGNVTVGGSLNISGQKLDAFSVTTTNNNVNQVIYEAPVVGFNTGRFQITTREFASTNSQTVTLVVTKRTNNTAASYSAFGTVFIGVPVTTYNADVAFGNIRIMVSPLLNTTMTHTVSYQIET